MKKIILFSSLVFGLIVASCSDFGDINTTPNETTKTSMAALLTSSLRSVSGVVSRTTEELYAQHMSETQYSDGSRYDIVNFDFNGWYTGPLANLQLILDMNSNPETAVDVLPSGSNNNQMAAARILKAYFYSFMTDRWGPLPYSQALKGREDFTPAYDSQDEIYTDLLKELKEAVAQIDGGNGVGGDFIFGGDMNNWKIFANTIRMNMALRMSEVDEPRAKAEFADAVAAGVISSNAGTIWYPYLAETNNENPWYSRFITRTDWAISSTLVDYMRPLGDARLDAFADPAPLHGEVRGMPYGIANAGDIPNADISFPHISNVRGQDAPIAIFTYSQVLFSRAEAAMRGWISGEDASAIYQDAIKASWEQWGVYDEDAFNTFMSQPDVEFSMDNGAERIGNQKWVALYLQGFEAWSEFRRTGWPALAPAPDPLNDSGQIPVRQGYPTSERDINSENYEAALILLGGPDELDTKLWWDK